MDNQEIKTKNPEVFELGYDLCLGSTSLHKLEALKDACLQLGIEAEIKGEKAASEINEQPYGFKETYKGAFNRAKNAKEKAPQAMAIGIENGIAPVADKYIDLAVVVVISPDGKIFTATSAGIEFPKEAVETARKKGFATTTAGSIIAQMTGCDPTDPHSFLTNGKTSRKEILTQALVLALSRFKQ